MDFFENVRLAFSGLAVNKMRALLTMLGIIIGIASVITVVMLGNAMTDSVSGVMGELGGNNITVMLQDKNSDNQYSSTSADKIDDADLISDDMINQFCARYAGQITAISLSESVGAGKAQDGHLYSNVSVSGVNDGYKAANNLTLVQGRFLTKRDNERNANTAVISDKTAAAIFGDSASSLGKEIQIHTSQNIQTYTVVGVYQYDVSTNMMGERAASEDVQTSLYIPLSTARKITGTGNGVQYFTLMVDKDSDATAFAKKAEDFFNAFYKNNVSYKCAAMSMESVISKMNGVMSSISVGIAAIAGISLLVGGIGVMNIMLVSVTERTREIGTRKALGATNHNIRTQFIVESVIICMIGGIIGTILGVVGGSLIATYLLHKSASPSIPTILIAVGFSMLIGVFFGYYPANKAAKMDPIEALRYE